MGQRDETQVGIREFLTQSERFLFATMYPLWNDFCELNLGPGFWANNKPPDRNQQTDWQGPPFRFWDMDIGS